MQALHTFKLKPRTYYLLENWEILEVNGEDAKKFLQGQVSCDLDEVENDKAQLGACINLKGRVICNFIVKKKTNDCYDLYCPPSSLKLIEKILKKYAIFSKVTINTPQIATRLLAFDSNIQNPVDSAPFSIPALSCKFLNVKATDIHCLENSLEAGNEKDFLIFCLTSGLCLISEENAELFTVQELNLELVYGVSFNKGCYTGQEVVARMHYRGIPKRRVFIAILDKPVQIAEKVVDQSGKALGDVVNILSSKEQVFALLSISIEARKQFPEQQLFIGENKVDILELNDPPYPLEKP